MAETAEDAEAARLARIDRAATMGIDRPLIGRLVDTFYGKIRQDARLGPVFDARVGDWDAHLLQMKRFWSALLLGDGGYHGRPMPKHVTIPDIEAPDFEHWLMLFRDTVRDVVRDLDAQTVIIARAEAIADSLLMGIRIHRDGRTDVAAMQGLR